MEFQKCTDAYTPLSPSLPSTVPAFGMWSFFKDVRVAAYSAVIPTRGTPTKGFKFIPYVRSDLQVRSAEGKGRRIILVAGDAVSVLLGVLMSSKDVAAKMRQTLPFMKSSGGGLTVSGGEAMMQPAFVAAIFREAHAMGITTCLDTSAQGSCSTEWDNVLDHTDIVLICIKHMRKEVYTKITKRRMAPAMKFVQRLDDRKIPFWIRYVLVPGLTTDVEDIELLCLYAKKQTHLLGIELLPYHLLGVDKWKQMGLEYPLKGVLPPTKSQVLAVIEQLKEHGLNVLCDLSTTRAANTDPH